MVDLYCESFQRVPKRITLDIDDTFDAVHGGQHGVAAPAKRASILRSLSRRI
jgi:hypothetical protein